MGPKRNKILIALVILIVGIILIKYNKVNFFTNAQIGVKYARWNNKDYVREEKEEWFYELDKKVAKNEWGYYLYSLKGDKNKDYHILWPSIANEDDNHLVYIESGFQIPTEGEVTGIIVAKDGNTLWNTKFIEQKKTTVLIRELLKENNFEFTEEEKELSQFANYYRIYLCFNNCPIAKKVVGYIVEQGKEYIVIRNKSSPFHVTDRGEMKIKKGVEYMIVDDKKIRREIRGIIDKFWWD